jgi:hypothetical protein
LVRVMNITAPCFENRGAQPTPENRKVKSRLSLGKGGWGSCQIIQK